MDGLQSDAAESLEQALGLAVRLGVMDFRGLGLAGRASEERDVHEHLQRELGEREIDLEEQLRRFDRDLGERTVGLVAAARAGTVDYLAEVQIGVDDVASPVLQEVGHPTLCLLEEERGGRSATTGVGQSA